MKAGKVIKLSASTGDEWRMLCPTCDTLCSISLDMNNKLWWKCGTLDCGFKMNVVPVINSVEVVHISGRMTSILPGIKKGDRIIARPSRTSGR